GLLAVGTHGALTGEAVTGIAVVDDPYKDRQDADSPVVRGRIEEWFREVVLTRLEGGSVIVCHARWHPEDLIGILAQDPAWEHVRMPAIAEEGDILGRAPGEALWPESIQGTLEYLRRMRVQMTEWSFASLYQQAPRPRGAEIFAPPVFYAPAEFRL